MTYESWIRRRSLRFGNDSYLLLGSLEQMQEIREYKFCRDGTYLSPSFCVVTLSFTD